MRKHLLKYMVAINRTEYANVFVIELIVYYILFLNTFCYNIICFARFISKFYQIK